ncbi:MAG: ThiF family adenylyltransferase [Corynebacterium sp.]|uniref:HesA/MoeB/ThiF family protein n=1 Tax=Corynebacterium sp. TaxID=1720 RepID=UPI0026DBC517|nr:ThiF family adenylyltransferase [Corynebacterium sp.]MDO5097955.1 ThiF family adenylyltransferase [Corynebacterium sp.]
MDVTAEFERTRRQRQLPNFDQDAVAGGTVMVIGAGGLGCPALQALAAAGVGKITIVDDDLVSLSNLHRQILFGVSDIGQPKVDVAARQLRQLQPGIVVSTCDRRITADNALSLIDGHDLVLDCTDTFAAKYLIADACEILEIPLVWGTVLGFSASMSVFRTGVVHLRDVFPTIPETTQTCATAGVLGATTAVVGSLMATEALKLLSSLPTCIGTIVTYDARTTTMKNFKVRRDPARTIPTRLPHHNEIDIFVDIRERTERELDVKIPDSVHVPSSAATQDSLACFFSQHHGKMLGVFCASGTRALQFIQQWQGLAAECGVTLVAL